MMRTSLPGDVLHDDERAAFEARIIELTAERELLLGAHRAALAEQRRLHLRLLELGTALREKHEEFLDMLDRLQEREEQAVRRSEERFRLLVESISDYAIFMLDPQGHLVSWNEGAARITGYSENEVLGQHVSIFYPTAEATTAAADQELRHAALEGRIEDEGWRMRRDGTTFWANVIVAPLRDELGRLLGFAQITRDLTERRRAEEALRRTALDLKRSNQELEQFAYVASHDLQEPLRKIQAFSDRIQARLAGVLDTRGTDYLTRMQDAVQRMQTLIEDVLALSRVTTKGQPFTEVDLGRAAQEAVADLEARLELSGGRVEIEPLATITADHNQVRRLLQNLIGNALKYHQPGLPPLVRIRGEPAELASGAEHDPAVPARIAAYRIYVEDNGIGFDEKYLDRIFGIFQRLHGRGEFEGTGIGLAICRKIVERHGGTITARSTPGVGSTFIVTLPVTQNSEVFPR